MIDVGWLKEGEFFASGRKVEVAQMLSLANAKTKSSALQRGKD